MDLTKESTEKLVATRAKLVAVLWAVAIVGVAAIALLIFLRAKLVHYIPVMVLPLTLLPAMISLRAVKAELKLRGHAV